MSFIKNVFILPITSSSVLVEMGIVTQYAFLGKVTNMLAKKKKKKDELKYQKTDYMSLFFFNS